MSANDNVNSNSIVDNEVTQRKFKAASNTTKRKKKEYHCYICSSTALYLLLSLIVIGLLCSGSVILLLFYGIGTNTPEARYLAPVTSTPVSQPKSSEPSTIVPVPSSTPIPTSPTPASPPPSLSPTLTPTVAIYNTQPCCEINSRLPLCANISIANAVCLSDPSAASCCTNSWKRVCIASALRLGLLTCSTTSCCTSRIKTANVSVSEISGCANITLQMQVCSTLKSCCSAVWNSACVSRAMMLGYDACTGQSCCEVAEKLLRSPNDPLGGCNSAFIQRSVCAINPSCCTNKWSAMCVSIVIRYNMLAPLTCSPLTCCLAGPQKILIPFPIYINVTNTTTNTTTVITSPDSLEVIQNAYGCNDMDAQAYVCNALPPCCDNEWSESCALLALAYYNTSSSSSTCIGLPSNDCCQTNYATGGCNNPAALLDVCTSTDPFFQSLHCCRPADALGGGWGIDCISAVSVLSETIECTPRSCCLEHPSPGCDITSVQTPVCVFIPSCCKNRWSADCVLISLTLFNLTNRCNGTKNLANPCCTQSDVGGCESATIMRDVCAIRPQCCKRRTNTLGEKGWSGECIKLSIDKGYTCNNMSCCGEVLSLPNAIIPIGGGCNNNTVIKKVCGNDLSVNTECFTNRWTSACAALAMPYVTSTFPPGIGPTTPNSSLYTCANINDPNSFRFPVCSVRATAGVGTALVIKQICHTIQSNFTSTVSLNLVGGSFYPNSCCAQQPFTWNMWTASLLPEPSGSTGWRSECIAIGIAQGLLDCLPMDSDRTQFTSVTTSESLPRNVVFGCCRESLYTGCISPTFTSLVCNQQHLALPCLTSPEFNPFAITSFTAVQTKLINFHLRSCCAHECTGYGTTTNECSVYTPEVTFLPAPVAYTNESYYCSNSACCVTNNTFGYVCEECTCLNMDTDMQYTDPLNMSYPSPYFYAQCGTTLTDTCSSPLENRCVNTHGPAGSRCCPINNTVCGRFTTISVAADVNSSSTFNHVSAFQRIGASGGSRSITPLWGSKCVAAALCANVSTSLTTSININCNSTEFEQSVDCCSVNVSQSISFAGRAKGGCADAVQIEQNITLAIPRKISNIVCAHGLVGSFLDVDNEYSEAALGSRAIDLTECCVPRQSGVFALNRTRGGWTRICKIAAVALGLISCNKITACCSADGLASGCASTIVNRMCYDYASDYIIFNSSTSPHYQQNKSVFYCCDSWDVNCVKFAVEKNLITSEC
jgi:hypothetical protein